MSADATTARTLANRRSTGCAPAPLTEGESLGCSRKALSERLTLLAKVLLIALGNGVAPECGAKVLLPSASTPRAGYALLECAKSNADLHIRRPALPLALARLTGEPEPAPSSAHLTRTQVRRLTRPRLTREWGRVFDFGQEAGLVRLRMHIILIEVSRGHVQHDDAPVSLPPWGRFCAVSMREFESTS